MISWKNRSWPVHLAGWVLFMAMLSAFHNDRQPLLTPGLFLYTAFFVLLFYANAVLLAPGLLLKGKPVLYGALLLLLLFLTGWIRPYDSLLHVRPPHDGPRLHGPRSGHRGPLLDIISIVVFLAAWSVSTALVITRRWRDSERRALQAEAGRTEAELSFLRAQISPHFLFNTLNNIYTLVLLKSEQAPEAVLKLSRILRYVTEEASATEVGLEQELAAIDHYVDLQLLRLSSPEGVQVRVEGTPEGHRIPPLLLLTFVENAFKYGVSAHEPPQIDIRLEATAAQLRFYCRNRIFRRESDPEERAGIGQANALRRLAHHFPGRHIVKTDNDGTYYSVTIDWTEHDQQ